MEPNDARREAYRYILERLSALETDPQERGSVIWIPLDELRMLKAGSADPSARLVASLRALLGEAVPPGEIHAHLVAPFAKMRQNRCRKEMN